MVSLHLNKQPGYSFFNISYCPVGLSYAVLPGILTRLFIAEENSTRFGRAYDYWPIWLNFARRCTAQGELAERIGITQPISRFLRQAVQSNPFYNQVLVAL